MYIFIPGFTISGNSYMRSTVYVDGIAFPTTADVTGIWNYTLPSRALEVVAVHILSDSDHQGFVMLITDQLFTDAAWRCSFHEEADWMEPGFNDLHWEKAAVITEDVTFMPAKSIYPSNARGQGEQDYYCRGSCKFGHISQ